MNIIFFDGLCGLCNGFVDFMLKVDKKGVFKFSPLQSDYARQTLPEKDIANLDSVVILIQGKTYRKSEAVFRALAELGGLWKTPMVLNLLPKKILNFGYDLVAENRYKIFGKQETCRLPTPEEQERFIL
jgi:predicted DCC family thiol-disulfide oxidoreductase YuxK